jgi:hypothetical protein
METMHMVDAENGMMRCLKKGKKVFISLDGEIFEVN